MTLTERAERARKELFCRYDELNTLWLKAEEELRKLHIPRDVERVYRSYEPDPDWPGHRDYLHLGLRKDKGKWRICHGASSDVHPEMSIIWTLITECSAEIRVNAAQYLPGLREAVVKSAEDFIPQVDAAIGAMKKALDTDINELLAERAKFNGKK